MKQKIDAIIEKYLGAETSVQEEDALRTYFSGRDIDSRHKDLAIVFALAERNKQTRLTPAFSTRLRNNIAEENSNLRPVISYRKRFTWMHAAASLVLLTGIFFITLHNWPSKKPATEEMMLKDTFTNPDDALKEIKKSLLTVSSKMQQGVDFFEINKKNQD